LLLQLYKKRLTLAQRTYTKSSISNNEDIGLATIYRVLTQFEAAGMVTKHHFENSKAVYEIQSDEHHDHMVDVDTGKVMEFHD
jgi:Fur family ferric uptake transcriptional regulator